jgi:hypothetical protein
MELAAKKSYLIEYKPWAKHPWRFKMSTTQNQQKNLSSTFKDPFALVFSLSVSIE